MKTIKKLVFACVAMVMATAGVTIQPAQAASNTVTYAMYGDIKDWDPAVASSLEIMMLVNVYEPLLWFNAPGSDELFSPALAESWSVSSDGLAWTFNLRKGVKFHDGEPMNAEAAKASLLRTKEMGAGSAWILGGIDAIEAPEEHTLVVKTKSPKSMDLILSSGYAAYIYSPKAAAKGTEWFNQGNAAGTGPYMVRQWEKGQQTVLEKNPDFHGGWTDKNFDRVILKSVTENATQVQMLKSGEADFISLVPADVVSSLNEEEGISAYAVDSWKNQQFLINTKKGATSNKKFRQALTHIWDYDSVVNDIIAGYAKPARGPLPASMWGHNDALKTPAHDLDKARKLIEESGVTDKKITMAYIGTSETYKNAALLFQANAAQVGVEVELLPGEWGVIWDNAKNLDTAPNLQSMTWWPSYPTPSDWLMGQYGTESKPTWNLSHYSNPKYDELVSAGLEVEATDRDVAVAKYAEAQEILMDDAVAIFFSDIKTRVARASDIEGLEVNPAYAAHFFHKLSRK